MLFTLTSTQALHESGSKFYQIITVRNEETKRAVIINHWGRNATGVKTPKTTGQCKVEQFEFGGVQFKEKASRTQREKSKRGYRNWESGNSHLMIPTGSVIGSLTLEGAEELKLWADKCLDPVSGKGVFEFLTASAAGAKSEAVELKAPVLLATASEDHEEWGTW